MNIERIQYQNDEQTALRVTTTDGKQLTVPWPCRTWHNEAIQEWLALGNVITEKPGPTLEESRQAKLDEINGAYQAQMDAILAEYPQAETLSFDKQEREARTWLSYPETTTPFLDALKDSRGIDKAELVKRVIAKADSFAQVSGAATGKRQALEDQIKTADADTLKTITW